MNLQEYRVDPDKFVDGVWIRFDAETEFLIAAYGSARHRHLIAREARTLALKSHEKMDEMQEAVVWAATEQRSLAGGVLLGWRGVKDGSAEVAFTPDAAAEMLRTCPQIAAWVTTKAREIHHFRAQAEDASGKA